MSLARILLLVGALTFLGWGAAFLISPELMMQWVVQESPASGSALTDLRATYGGMSLALGAVLAWLMRDPESVRSGIIILLLTMIGMAGGRTLGIVLNGDPNTKMWLFLALEVGAAVACVFCLARTGHSENVKS